MRRIVRQALGLALLLGLSGGWFAYSAFAQSADLADAKRLNDQLVQLYRQGKYAEAIPLAQRVLSIREKTLGPEHPDAATSLNNLAELYSAMGKYATAELLATERKNA